MSKAATYRKNYYKKKNKPNYKINSNVEDRMVGRILIMGGSIVKLHNNWHDTKKYKVGGRSWGII